AYRVFSVDEAIAHIRTGAPLGLHPLVGGLPPEIAWRYLKVVGEQVMPALRS
ncbi:MAG: Luciferase-like, subgroup, partial [Mycobacterium sp.]|nr:Luciferase-like, subgroup [Mycobacterium sp.]